MNWLASLPPPRLKTGHKLAHSKWVWSESHVRFGSKADMCSARRHVRFAPESGHLQCNSVCPLSANSGHARSLNYVVRNGKDPLRNVEPECLCGCEIDNELELRRLQHRQVVRLRTLKDAASVGAHLTKHFC